MRPINTIEKLSLIIAVNFAIVAFGGALTILLNL
jgi:hypothetical protein